MLDRRSWLRSLAALPFIGVWFEGASLDAAAQVHSDMLQYSMTLEEARRLQQRRQDPGLPIGVEDLCKAIAWYIKQGHRDGQSGDLHIYCNPDGWSSVFKDYVGDGKLELRVIIRAVSSDELRESVGKVLYSCEECHQDLTLDSCGKMIHKSQEFKG